MYFQPSSKTVIKDHSAIRASVPSNILLPAVITDNDLTYLGIYPLFVDDCPTEIGKSFTLAAPRLVDGEWRQEWVAHVSSEEELAEARQKLIDLVTKRTTARLNAFAATRNYGDERTDPIISACSYASSSHVRYGVEGRYCMEMREQTWDKLYAIMADVLAGKRPMLSSFEEIEPELPVMAWPDEQVNPQEAESKVESHE